MTRLSLSIFEKLLIVYARHFPIRRGKLRVINHLWRAALRDENTDRLAELKHGGLRMPCDLNEMLQRQFYFFGTYFLEEDILDCWENEARGAKVIFDIGANAGIFSLAALAVQPDASVYAFEPTPEIARRLRETGKLNKLDNNLHVHEAAVSGHDGQAFLQRWRGELGTNEGMNYITAAAGDSEKEPVQIVSLDRFCADHAIDHIDIIKLDIQGHEHQALAGAERMLNEGRVGTIFTELNWAKDANSICPATESIRLLEQMGYRFSRPSTNLRWETSGDWMRTLSDVIARRALTD